MLNIAILSKLKVIVYNINFFNYTQRLIDLRNVQIIDQM